MDILPLCLGGLCAQDILDLNEPTTRIVFQRAAYDSASITISGLLPTSDKVTAIEARATAIDGGVSVD